ncbi:hypothetical protein [Aeromonas hydrophila]|uniref:hypothetical protein n=1 Tax=Aeromonas hydrophila TaxID=644 RepID=UPI002B49FFBA|nr:hypothetical protein [Aeromonas hydrophila]
MNSRQRRKLAAQEHNDRPALLQELREVRSAIHAKHGAWVQAVIDSSNDSVRREIAKMHGILEADAPPSRPVAVGGGAERLRAYKKLAIIAALAGMGV